MKTKILLMTTAAIALAACSNTADVAEAPAAPQTQAQVQTAAANEAVLAEMKAEMGVVPETAPQEVAFPENEPEDIVQKVEVKAVPSEAPTLIKASTTPVVEKVKPKPAPEPKVAPISVTEPEMTKVEVAPEIIQVASNDAVAAETEASQPAETSNDSQAETSQSADASAADAPDTEKEANVPADPWTQILQAYTVKDGSLVRFDYSALSKNKDHMALLGNYIDDLAGQKPSAMSRDEGLAYWANLYNALTVQVVAENWPVKSIKEIKSGTFTSGPWKRDIVTVEGRTLSLDGIEHDTMRATWDEPRIHYMVNCASVGCPNLMQRAWSADTLEADLNAAAADYINSDRGGVISGNSVKISSIFKWYKEDFGGNNSGVLAHMKKYATGDKKAALENVTKVSGDTYDWDVNAGSAPASLQKKISAEKMKDME